MTLSGHNLHIIICRLLVEYTASEILTLLSKDTLLCFVCCNCIENVHLLTNYSNIYIFSRNSNHVRNLFQFILDNYLLI